MAQAKTPGSADTVRVGTPPANVGADVTTIAGSTPVKSENLSSADQETVVGDGSARRPLHGGGGSGGIDVLDDGDPAVPGATTLNFSGNVSVTDAGGGEASIVIAGDGGVDVQNDGDPVVAPATTLNLAPGLLAVDDGGGVATISATDLMEIYATGGGQDIDPTIDCALLQWNDLELPGVFHLGDGDDGSGDDHLLDFCVTGSSQGEVQIDVDNLQSGPHTLTIANSSAPAGGRLAWKANQGTWFIVTLYNCTFA